MRGWRDSNGARTGAPWLLVVVTAYFMGTMSRMIGMGTTLRKRA